MEKLLEWLNSEDTDQELIRVLKKQPLIHFSNESENILEQGFIYGESLPHKLDYTFNEHGKTKKYYSNGYNFAFSILDWCVINNCYDYQIGIPKYNSNYFNSMYYDKAIIFIGDGAYVKHYDDFNQFIFKGIESNKENFILLERVTSLDNKYLIEHECVADVWTAKDRYGNFIVNKIDSLDLNNTIKKVLNYFIVHNFIEKNNDIENFLNNKQKETDYFI